MVCLSYLLSLLWVLGCPVLLTVLEFCFYIFWRVVILLLIVSFACFIVAVGYILGFGGCVRGLLFRIGLVC